MMMILQSISDREIFFDILNKLSVIILLVGYSYGVLLSIQ